MCCCFKNRHAPHELAASVVVAAPALRFSLRVLLLAVQALLVRLLGAEQRNAARRQSPRKAHARIWADVQRLDFLNGLIRRPRRRLGGSIDHLLQFLQCVLVVLPARSGGARSEQQSQGNAKRARTFACGGAMSSPPARLHYSCGSSPAHAFEAFASSQQLASDAQEQRQACARLLQQVLFHPVRQPVGAENIKTDVRLGVHCARREPRA